MCPTGRGEGIYSQSHSGKQASINEKPFKSKFTMKLLFKKPKELVNLKLELNALLEQTAEASGFIKEIEKGNLQINTSEQLNNSELGISLLSMQKHLSKIAVEEQERTWANAGLAKFSDILRNKQSFDLKDLADDILLNLAKYVNANQGALFVLEDGNKDEEHLEMIACYAYDRKKFLNKKIRLGEGLAGQCVLEKETMYLTEIPQGYLSITSGLGEATPKSILISPLIINDKVFGVLELASFEQFLPHKIDFINRLSENIASSIKNVKDNERTQLLLIASQQQAEELRAQEEEMRQNMEEMQATQEEMGRKNDEIAKVAAESSGLLKGINNTMATIEFTPEGFVVAANDNFLKAIKSSFLDIKGIHHRYFVPKEIVESEEYKNFWTTLASGKSISGIFKRMDSRGETVLLNAIYNPIVDANNKVIKVIKFANDVTAEQELLAENKGVIKGINATMATIEFTPDGNVITANDNFLKTIQSSLDDIKGKHHRNFVPQQFLESGEYINFWTRLASGVSISGIFELVNSKGEPIWINAIYNPIKNASGEVCKVVNFAFDVTTEKQKEFEVKQLLEESKIQEAEIAKNLEKIKAIQEDTERVLQEKTFDLKVREDVFGITSILSEADLFGNILYANEKLAEVSKYAIAEMVGKPHSLFRHPDMPKELFKLFWETLKKGDTFKGIIKNKAKDGSHYWVDGCFVPIKDSKGNVIKYVGARYHIVNDDIALLMYNEQATKLGFPKL
jgi:PAS domain S-box-containing protein